MSAGAGSSSAAGSSASGAAGAGAVAGASAAGSPGASGASGEGGGADNGGSAGAGLGGASSGSGGATAGSDAGGQCNSAANLGLDVKGKTAPGAFPSIGPHTTLPDGIYVLSSSVWYANLAPSPQVRKRTLVIHGTEMQTVTSEDYGPEERVSFTINPGDFLNQVPTCGLESDWDKDKKVAWGISRPDSIDIREPYGMWANRIDTYTLVK